MKKENIKECAIEKFAKAMTIRVLSSLSLAILLLILATVAASPLLSAQLPDLNLKISANLNANFNTDFYALTNSGSNSSYDGYDASTQPIQTNDSRLFSWLKDTGLCPYPSSLSWANCTLVIDSWPVSPASTRAFYLVFRVNPSSSGTLNISWNSSILGGNYTALLVDYNNSYNYTTNASPPINMETNSFYSVSTGTFSYRYLLLNITLLPYCGDGICSPEAGETYDNCPIDGCQRPSDECDINEDCEIGEECIDGNCLTCTQNCSTEGYECGIHTFCREEVDCGACGINEICSNGNCISVACTSDAQCNDNNVCTNDTCIDNICQYSFNTVSCNDNDSCTINDVCSNGICSGVFKCEANEQCVDGVCQLIIECSSDTDCPENQVCIDSRCVPLTECDPPCTAPEQCVNGECREIPALGGAAGASPGCTSNFVCGEWSECLADYNVEDLIYQTGVSGIETRLCIDKNNCLVNFEEKQNCSLKEEIVTKNKIWCGQAYTEIIDASSGQVLARLKPGISGKMVNIDLNVEGEGFCPYCFDGVKNYDEEDIDCGGSCISCLKFKAAEKVIFKPFLLFVLLLVLLLLIILLVVLIKKFVMLLKIEHLENLKARYTRWKKKGYNVSVLHKDIEALSEELRKLKSK